MKIMQDIAETTLATTKDSKITTFYHIPTRHYEYHIIT